MKHVKTVLLVLLVLRLGYSALSPAGAGWDFVQYYRTATRICTGEIELLYRIDGASMNQFLAAIGEPTESPDSESALVPSGRLGHVGMPLSALYIAPIGLLPPRQAMLAFKLAGALCFALAWWLLFGPFREAVSGRVGKAAAAPLYLALCLAFEPFWFVFTAGGQSTPLNFLLLVLFYRLWVADRPALAALALALGVLVKPFFLLSGFVLLLARDRRPFLYLTMFLGLQGLLSVALFGLELHLEWLRVLQVSAGGLAEPWWNNSAVLGLLYTLWSVGRGAALAPAGELHGLAGWWIAAYKVGILLLFGYLTRQRRVAALAAPDRRHHLALLAILFPLLFSNIVWPHYLSFLFIPLVFLLFPARSLGRTPQLLAWAALLSTLAVRGRFVQRTLLSGLDSLPWLQGAVAGLFGSATTILTLTLLVWFAGRAVTLLRRSPEPFARDAV